MTPQIKIRQVEQLYANTRLQFFFAFLIFGLYTIFIHDLIDRVPLIIWCLWFNLAIIIRGISFLKFNPAREEGIPVNAWLWIHVCTSFLFGTSQAWLTQFFDPSWPTHVQIAFWMLIVSVIALTIRGLSTVFIDYVAFTAPMLLASVITLFQLPVPEYHSLAWMILFYAFGVYVTAFSAYSNNTRRIQFEASLVEANKKLGVLASRDPLTNLPNRRAFDEYIHDEWERHKRSASVLSLLMIDVDYFKQYNDAYGHTAGDDCLIRIANQLNGCLKRPADKAARYGGEEFVVLLPDTPIQGALEVAERILTSIRQLGIPHVTSPSEEFLTVSIGLASIDPEEGNSSNDLFHLADTELYRAKAGGRNRLSRYSPVPGQEPSAETQST